MPVPDHHCPRINHVQKGVTRLGRAIEAAEEEVEAALQRTSDVHR